MNVNACLSVAILVRVGRIRARNGVLETLTVQYLNETSARSDWVTSYVNILVNYANNARVDECFHLPGCSHVDPRVDLSGHPIVKRSLANKTAAPFPRKARDRYKSELYFYIV